MLLGSEMVRGWKRGAGLGAWWMRTISAEEEDEVEERFELGLGLGLCLFLRGVRVIQHMALSGYDGH